MQFSLYDFLYDFLNDSLLYLIMALAFAISVYMPQLRKKKSMGQLIFVCIFLPLAVSLALAYAFALFLNISGGTVVIFIITAYFIVPISLFGILFGIVISNGKMKKIRTIVI